MRNRVEKPILSARVLVLLGAVARGALLGAALSGALVACQSAPLTSKEPASKEPVREVPAAALPAPTGAPTLQNQAALSPQAVAPQAVAPAASAPEAESAKLTGGAAPVAAAQAAADKPAPGKASDKGAAEKPADAKATAGKTVQGAVVSEEPFSTWLQVASPAHAGAPLQLEVVLVAKPPYHCNAEYPHKFKLNTAPAGLNYPEETVRGMKVTPERGVLAIPVNAQSAGKPTVAGTLSFSVCTEERCLVEKRELSVALDVM